MDWKKIERAQIVACVTGQHLQIFDIVLETFDVTSGYDLPIMKLIRLCSI